MTPRSLWTILIKILGIYIILDSLTGIPAFLSTIISFRSMIQITGTTDVVLFQFGYYLVVIITYGFICWLSLFKTDWLIDKLILDKGYQDEKFEFTMHRSTILKITVMIIGAIMLTSGFPWLCRYTFAYFQQVSEYKRFKDSPQSALIICYFLQTFIGYFMLTCSRIVVNYIELKRKKPAPEIIIED
jgi:hypothetical protein